MTRPPLLAASLLACMALVAPIAVDAQSRGKAFRVGYIQTATPEEQAHLTRAFEEGMRELGYVEGQNLAITYRWADGRVMHVRGLVKLVSPPCSTQDG